MGGSGVIFQPGSQGLSDGLAGVGVGVGIETADGLRAQFEQVGCIYLGHENRCSLKAHLSLNLKEYRKNRGCDFGLRGMCYWGIKAASYRER